MVGSQVDVPGFEMILIDPETTVSKEVNKEFREVSVNKLFGNPMKFNANNPEASNEVKPVLPATEIRETHSEMFMELTIEL